MILSCPSCTARFEIDAAHLGSTGRKVRCGKCGHTWLARPDDTVPSVVEEPSGKATTPAGDDGDRGSDSDSDRSETSQHAEAGAPSLVAEGLRPTSDDSESRERKGRTTVGWLLLLAVVLALLGGAWFGRDWVIGQVPQAATLYALLGIEADPRSSGLEIRDVTSVRRTVDGRALLVLEGRVVNVGAVAREVPRLRAQLLDSDGRIIVSWDFDAEQRALDPGAETDFVTLTDAPPDRGSLSIGFAPGN